MPAFPVSYASLKRLRTLIVPQRVSMYFERENLDIVDMSYPVSWAMSLSFMGARSVSSPVMKYCLWRCMMAVIVLAIVSSRCLMASMNILALSTYCCVKARASLPAWVLLRCKSAMRRSSSSETWRRGMLPWFTSNVMCCVSSTLTVMSGVMCMSVLPSASPMAAPGFGFSLRLISCLMSRAVSSLMPSVRHMFCHLFDMKSS